MNVRTHISAAIASAIVLGALATATNAETLRISGAGSKNFSQSRAIDEVFVPGVAEVTEGRHEVQTFWGSQLGGNTESVAQVRSGTIFGAYAATSYFASIVPELNAFNLPFLFDSREKALATFDGPIGDEIRAKLEEKGFVVLGFMELGFRQVTNSVRPIATPEDMEGLKIRVQPNPTYMELFRLLGANPIQLDIKDLFSALQQRVADGQENPYVFIDLLGLHEANQKYVTDTAHVYEVMLFVASKEVMDRMSPEDRQAVIELGERTAERQREISAEMDETGKERLLENGYELTTLTPEQRAAFREKSAPIYEELTTGEQGEFAKSLIEAAE